MKIASTVVVIALCAGLLTACSKQESQTPEPPKSAAEVQKKVETAKPAAQEAAGSVASNAQSMIDKAKSLIADNKYSEATDLLKKLSSMELTPEQKKLVDDLMAQAQKAMAGAASSEATKSVGGLLGK